MEKPRISRELKPQGFHLAARVTGSMKWVPWKMSTGPVGYGGNGNVVNYPGSKTFGTIPAPQSVNNSVSIMADQDLAFLADDLNLPSSSSSLQFFQGVTITLKNHFFTVMMIVVYDAAGVRRQAGYHAEKINAIINELFAGHPISEEALNEVLGHTPREVLGGVVTGIVIALGIWVLWQK